MAGIQLPKGIGRNQAVEVFGNVAQTNYYLLNFSGFQEQGPLGELTNHLKTNFGVDAKEVLEKTGIMCSEATLPGSSLATAEVKDNFMGIPQEYAHTRLYTDIDFTFYVDRNYTNLKFFEGWIDYIASGSQGPVEGASVYSSNYYRRMRYPDSYKCSSMFITKFERDIEGPTITYQFINAFPKLVTAVPVSYGGADILRVSASFNYDRYIVNPKSSFEMAQKNTYDPESSRESYNPAIERERIAQQKAQSLARTSDTRQPSGARGNNGGNGLNSTDGDGSQENKNLVGNKIVGTGPTNYGIAEGQTRYFASARGGQYRVENVNGNIVITKNMGFGQYYQITSTATVGSEGSAWLFDDLKRESAAGNLRTSGWFQIKASK